MPSKLTYSSSFDGFNIDFFFSVNKKEDNQDASWKNSSFAGIFCLGRCIRHLTRDIEELYDDWANKNYYTIFIKIDDSW